jgi:bifunctional non-homologous end joining protein LigD
MSARSRGDSGEDVVAGVRLTHADRVLYPEQGVTKRDLALFYVSIEGRILPHLAGRPTTLVRCPEGISKPCFYQKHTGWWAPPALTRAKIQEKTKVGEYLIADDLTGLVGLVQIGILEIHTWNSVITALETPDRLVIDLDPDEGLPWPRIVEAARLVKDRLEERGLSSFVKTTGGKGLHVVAPLSPRAGWDECAAFSRELCAEIEAESPERYTTTMAKARRKGRVFLDWLRNVRGATSVAAYSTRAKPGAPISTPLAWTELGRKTRPEYTLATLPRRLSRLTKDPWAGYERARRPLRP